MCANNCECNCTSPITMYCSLPSPNPTQCFDSICKRNGTCCEIQIISSSSQIVICNSTSLTQTLHNTVVVVEFTTSSVVSKIITSIKSSITTFFQTSSFAQSTSSRYSSVKSEKMPSITPHFSTLSSAESTILIVLAQTRALSTLSRASLILTREMMLLVPQQLSQYQ